MGIILNSSQCWYKEYIHQKARSSCPIVILKKLGGRCESQEEVAVCIALEHFSIYFGLSVFRGNSVISLRAVDISPHNIPGGPAVFVCCVGGCVLSEEADLWLSGTITLRPRAAPAVSCGDTGLREGNPLQLVFGHGGVLFSLCQLSASSRDTNKHSSPGKYCDWQQPCVLAFSFSTIAW